MKRLKRVTYWNRDLAKGVDLVFVLENNQIISKHTDYLNAKDWR